MTMIVRAELRSQSVSPRDAIYDTRCNQCLHIAISPHMAVIRPSQQLKPVEGGFCCGGRLRHATETCTASPAAGVTGWGWAYLCLIQDPTWYL